MLRIFIRHINPETFMTELSMIVKASSKNSPHHASVNTPEV